MVWSFCQNWGYIMVVTMTPTFMEKVLHFNIKDVSSHPCTLTISSSFFLLIFFNLSSYKRKLVYNQFTEWVPLHDPTHHSGSGGPPCWPSNDILLLSKYTFSLFVCCCHLLDSGVWLPLQEGSCPPYSPGFNATLELWSLMFGYVYDFTWIHLLHESLFDEFCNKIWSNFQKGFVAILAIGMTAGLVVIPQLATWELRFSIQIQSQNIIRSKSFSFCVLQVLLRCRDVICFWVHWLRLQWGRC